ncbi:MAG TPA: hypothetical protein VJQ59_10300 [Candidatus Sulfotelmatobacter sp.]|nr:hypothetical protein [Candidatus Sulfotelmatobacter sp.]
MRKTLLFILLLSLSFGGMTACGGGNNGISGQKDQPSISISPMNPGVLVGQTLRFTANIQNLSDTRVAWSVQEENGGTIASTDTGGLYTAPWPVGIYHVVATSVADPSLTTNTMVGVTAQFAFLEELPTGDAFPFSMTPIIGTVGTDGSVGLANVIDQGPGTPVSVAMSSITLSNDGTKAAFDVVTQDTSGNDYYDVYVANADGTGSPTQLTATGNSFWPQFSADGQQILYMNNWDIWAMNVDGSNQHVVFSADLNNAGAWSATLSPDGTKIAAELDWYPPNGGGAYYDGIVIMNADGSNPIALTGNSGCNGTMPAGGWDEMPSFTHDGTQIMFSRFCTSASMLDSTETMYLINTDGTGLTQIYSDPTPGLWNYNPVAVADRILFQSNQNAPSNYVFEIYSMKSDGSGVTRLTNNFLYDGFDTSWYAGPVAANSVQVLRSGSSATLSHAARRAEKMKKLQQRRR